MWLQKLYFWNVPLTWQGGSLHKMTHCARIRMTELHFAPLACIPVNNLQPVATHLPVTYSTDPLA